MIILILLFSTPYNFMTIFVYQTNKKAQITNLRLRILDRVGPKTLK